MVELETQTLPLTRAAKRAEGAQGKTFTFDAFTCVKEFAYTNQLPWKHYWLFYPFYSLSAGNVGRKVKKQREDAAHKSKNHKNKCLMGPLKSLEAPGKYPLSPPPIFLSGPATDSYQQNVHTNLHHTELKVTLTHRYTLHSVFHPHFPHPSNKWPFS